jgi:hypothetical protein
MKKLLILFLLLSGCSSNQMTVAWYGAEAIGYTSFDRYKRSDDVVLVLGENGEPNVLCMRRGNNILWGPSKDLKEKSGLGFWEYTERNRKIQIYDNIAIARYGKYKFDMSPDAEKAWKKYEEWMSEKYKTQTDYIMYEHLLRKKAKVNEAQSEMKQEAYMFKNRGKSYE